MASAILRRYLDLRAITGRHYEAALDRVSPSGFLDHAKLLGLAEGGEILAESDGEFALIFDLALHFAKRGRSCALDRYAKSALLPPGSADAEAVAAMRRARFSIWGIEDYHESEGLIIADVMRGEESWLVDQNLSRSMEPGMMFVGRLLQPAEFVMTSGVVVPLDPVMFVDALIECPRLLRHGDVARLADDPQFSVAMYRPVIESGVLDNVRYVEPMEAA
jgi:hypothetical protein